MTQDLFHELGIRGYLLKCLCKRNLYFKSPEIVCKAGKLLILLLLAEFLRIRHLGFIFLNLSCCRFISYRGGWKSLFRGVAISTCVCLIPHWRLNARTELPLGV
ncbi:hypothetical protein AAHE18_19G177300 [Arachis hypogaea]